MNRRILVSILVGLQMLSLQAVHASDLGVAQDDFSPKWEVTLSPYVWVPGIKGSSGAFGLGPISIDSSPLDTAETILENFDFAAIGAANFQYGDYGLFVDLIHVQLSTDKATPGPLFSSVEVGITQTTLTAMATYRAYSTSNANFDLMAGARLWNLDLDFALTPGLLPGRAASDGDTWIDPMVGFKGKYEINDQWSLSGWGMVGAGASNISWDIYAGANYEFSETFSMVAGFRAAGVDYQKGGFLFDVTMYGPVIGATFKF